jgi:DNA-binding HxlR family transcriptional regulator
MANQKNSNNCLCPLGGIIELISKKWALLIINTIGNDGTLRFNRLQERLDGINPKTLSSRLKEIESYGIIKREFFSEIPPRVEYSLTNEGKELRKAMESLLEWVYRYDMKFEKGSTSCDAAYNNRKRKKSEK